MVQFIWWGYHLIELTSEVSEESEIVSKRIVMILGEGAVFLLLLIIGLWQIKRSIKKELRLSERQNNFLLSVTHELKTPLATNKLYLQTITKRDLNADQRRELIHKAIEENSRLERMIDNILNASRLENNVLTVERSNFKLKPLFEQVADRFNAFLEKKIINIECEGEIQVNADRFMLEAVLNNLVENALKYAGHEHPITLFAKRDSEKVEFGVADLGPGIPKDKKSEIFEKFVRLGNEDVRTQKGSGLGLFIVAELVKMHNASIKCNDNSPNGAIFTITFING